MFLQVNQRGASSLTWLLMLSVAGFSLLCISRIVPVYLDDRYVVVALRKLSENPELENMTRLQINSHLNKFSQLNNLRGEEAESFQVIKRGDRTLVNSVYEKRVHIIKNIDLVMTFEHQLDSSNRDACCDFLIANDSAK